MVHYLVSHQASIRARRYDCVQVAEQAADLGFLLQSSPIQITTSASQ